MTVDEIIADVHAAARGRTRYEGQEPRRDEVLVAEIERLRARIAEMEAPVPVPHIVLDEGPRAL